MNLPPFCSRASRCAIGVAGSKNAVQSAFTEAWATAPPLGCTPTGAAGAVALRVAGSVTELSTLAPAVTSPAEPAEVDLAAPEPAGAPGPLVAGVPHDAVANVTEITPTAAQTARLEWVMITFSHISNEDFRRQGLAATSIRVFQRLIRFRRPNRQEFDRAEAVNLMNRHRTCCVAASALAAAVMTISACGTTAPANPAVRAVGCPARPPALAEPTPGARAPVLPPGAVAATICQYAPSLPGGKALSAPVRQLVLHGQAAAGLGAVLDGTAPITAQAARCDRPASLLPFEQVIYLGYRDGQTVRAGVTFTGCLVAVVAAAGRFGYLSSPVQDDLFGYTLLAAHDLGPRVPNVIGLGPSRAASVAARQRFSLTVDGEVIDPAAAAGTVIFQVPPPSVPDPGPSPYSLGAIVAVRSAPDCRASQLQLSYRGGGAGMGNDFGEIVFRNVAPSPCSLIGPLQVTGASAAGRSVTNTVTATVAAPGVLEPDTPPARAGAALPSGAIAWPLRAEYRDDPTGPNGLCVGHYVIPAHWRVRLDGGSVVVVPNADSGNPVRGLSSSGGLVTCRGRLRASAAATLAS